MARQMYFHHRRDSETSAHLASTFLAIWSLRTVKCTYRALQRVLGSIQWLALPYSPVGPWLSPVYKFLHNYKSCKLLPLNLWCFLITAYLTTIPPTFPRRIPPPCTMPPVFCDAAPSNDTFVVACVRPRSFATAVQTPRWIKSIQDAELYAVFHTLRQLSLQGITHACVYTDNQAVFYSVLHGKVSSHAHARGRILRRIYRLCLQEPLNMQMVLIPSSWNTADSYSRLAAPNSPNNPVILHSRFLYASIVPPLWYRKYL